MWPNTAMKNRTWIMKTNKLCMCNMICNVIYVIHANSYRNGNQQSLHVLITILQWRHNEHDGASNHQPHDCLLNLYSGAENIKALRHWPLCGEFTGDRWTPPPPTPHPPTHPPRWTHPPPPPPTKGQERRKCFHLMTSSWTIRIV